MGSSPAVPKSGDTDLVIVTFVGSDAQLLGLWKIIMTILWNGMRPCTECDKEVENNSVLKIHFIH